MTKLLKNIFQGAGTAFSIIPPPQHRHAEKLYKPHKSDSAALQSDWNKIGGDFDKAIKRVVNGKK